MHPLALAASSDDTGAAQISEMAGDLGLALAEDFDKVADADLALVHQVQQSQTSGIRESGEELGQVVGL